MMKMKTPYLSHTILMKRIRNLSLFPKNYQKGLTEYVIRTGKSLLAPKEYYLKLAKEGKIEISGSISEVWIGIPFRIENKIVGIVSVQSYKDASFL